MNVESGRESYAVYDFGDFRLDVGERVLTRGTRRLRLAPKTFDVLVALVARANRLVTKRELLQHVWPDVFVEEGILTVHIAQLRKALGDTRQASRVIETVSGSGYRFIGAVTPIVTNEGEAERRPPPGPFIGNVLPAWRPARTRPASRGV